MRAPGPLRRMSTSILEFPSRNSYYECMNAKVSEKGQVTIPKALRDQLGIRAGDELDFAVEGDRVVAAKVVGQDPFERRYGTLRLPASTDELIDMMRGPAVAPLPGELEER